MRMVHDQGQCNNIILIEDITQHHDNEGYSRVRRNLTGRIGSGRVSRPDPTREKVEVCDPTRPDPTRPDPILEV